MSFLRGKRLLPFCVKVSFFLLLMLLAVVGCASLCHPDNMCTELNAFVTLQLIKNALYIFNVSVVVTRLFMLEAKYNIIYMTCGSGHVVMYWLTINSTNYRRSEGFYFIFCSVELLAHLIFINEANKKVNPHVLCT